MNFIK